jgi:hypothetical protein
MDTDRQEHVAYGHPEYGTEYFSWMIEEYPRYERGFFWYVFMGAAGIGLLIYSVMTANFLFALIIIMFAMVMYLTSLNRGNKIRFSITEAGLLIGESFYPYKDIQRYWFVYEPPEVKNMYFEFKSPLSPRLSVDLGQMNPNAIRQILGRVLVEDFNEDEEPVSDYLARLFKL